MSVSRCVAMLVLAVLGTSLLAAPASAAISAAKARKQLKAARKAAIAQMKSGAEVAMEELFLAVRQLEIDVVQGQYDVTKLDQFVAAYSEAQREIREAMATTNFYNLAAQILIDLADGADLNGDYPKGFESGDGGTLDDFEADAHAMLDALYVKLEKRLRKTAKLMEQEGIFFTFRVRRPGGILFGTANPNGGIQPNLLPYLEMDGAFASSLASADDDGVVIVTGLAFPFSSLSIVMGPGSFGGQVDEQVPNARFIGDPITDVPEGNYFATVYDNSPMNTSPHAAITFHVR